MVAINNNTIPIEKTYQLNELGIYCSELSNNSWSEDRVQTPFEK
jgi:hypothetical protein